MERDGYVLVNKLADLLEVNRSNFQKYLKRNGIDTLSLRCKSSNHQLALAVSLSQVLRIAQLRESEGYSVPPDLLKQIFKNKLTVFPPAEGIADAPWLEVSELGKQKIQTSELVDQIERNDAIWTNEKPSPKSTKPAIAPPLTGGGEPRQAKGLYDLPEKPSLPKPELAQGSATLDKPLHFRVKENLFNTIEAHTRLMRVEKSSWLREAILEKLVREQDILRQGRTA